MLYLKWKHGWQNGTELRFEEQVPSCDLHPTCGCFFPRNSISSVEEKDYYPMSDDFASSKWAQVLPQCEHFRAIVSRRLNKWLTKNNAKHSGDERSKLVSTLTEMYLPIYTKSKLSSDEKKEKALMIFNLTTPDLTIEVSRIPGAGLGLFTLKMISTAEDITSCAFTKCTKAEVLNYVDRFPAEERQSMLLCFVKHSKDNYHFIHKPQLFWFANYASEKQIMRPHLTFSNNADFVVLDSTIGIMSIREIGAWSEIFVNYMEKDGFYLNYDPLLHPREQSGIVRRLKSCDQSKKRLNQAKKSSKAASKKMRSK